MTLAVQANAVSTQQTSAHYRRWLAIAQIALAIWIVYHYEIEAPALPTVMSLAACGFVISTLLPDRYRLPLFVVLSLLGLFAVLGLTDGAWLIAICLLLIGTCHLPLPGPTRVFVLVLLGGLLAALRMTWGSSPWSSALWPVLGSMCMFRLILYVRAILSGEKPTSAWNTLAYFFMLPNVAFPLFPVVDYKTFQRSCSKTAEDDIYDRGLLWISRGLTHLILYRVIYNNVLNDPAEISSLGDLVQFMLGTFLLYLRVSGQFHIAIGILHLFGFGLPETNKLYYLSSGFTDMWRRMNIYWTEFMTKTVFNPTYFRLKGLGQIKAVGLATAVVFIVTWFLHSYQWFWLRGGFPLRFQDILFWGILGILVHRGVMKEFRPRQPSKNAIFPARWISGLKAAATFFVICFLWSLWSVQSLADWIWLMSAGTNVDAKGLALLSAAFTTVFVLATLERSALQGSSGKWAQTVLTPTARSIVGLILLLAVAQPAVRTMLPPSLASALNSVQSPDVNARDNFAQSRGYYEQLDENGGVEESPPATVAEAFEKIMRNQDTCEWQFHTKRWRLRDDNLLMMDLTPSLHLPYPRCWTRSMTFSTNSWGMRDKEYALEKPGDTLRIAISGASHVMGNGVSDGETFEQVVEDRLQREFKCERYQRFEILNFGVDSYGLIQQLVSLEENGFKFSPDITIMTVRRQERSWMRLYLSNVASYHARISDDSLQELLQNAGLADIDRSRVPIPFQSWRVSAKKLGIEPAMPSSELEARVERVADEVINWSWQHFSEMSALHGALPIALAIDAVLDGPPVAIPNLEAIENAGIHAINLYDVFPAGQREAIRVSEADIHPNAAGHRIIADRLYEELVPIIRAKCMTHPEQKQ